MCEIVLIYYLQKQIGETYERGGRDSTLIRVLFVLSWIFAELFCVVAGVVITGEPLVGYGFGVLGIICVCVVFFIIANAAPPVTRRERNYMDDYHEYRETGNVRIVRPRRRRRRDPEDEDDPPRRRDDDPEDDRPRRRRDSRDEDDRPRRGDGIRRDREDEEPRPRRRPRDEDEDY